MSIEFKEKILKILEEEIVPAEGCTEPIALAYVAAKASEYLDGEPVEADIYVSGNMIKNVKSVVVPNSGGMVGIEVATAMGMLAGDANKELMVICDVTKDDMVRVREFLSKGKMKVIHEKNNIKLYIRIVLRSQTDEVSIEVKHIHTNITEIKKGGKTVLKQSCNDADFNSPLEDRQILTIKRIYELAKVIEIERIKELFDKVISCNTAIAKVGLSEKYGVNIGSTIESNMEKGIYGRDEKNSCASFAAAGSDARMSGCSLPVMTTSGSGNQGMAASLPIIKYCKMHKIEAEKMYRALFMSHLSTIHIKTNVGRLSAYCGVMCATAGVSGALTYLKGGDYHLISKAIINTLGNVSGIICDGAKASCAMKVATGVYSAFDSAHLSLNLRHLNGGDGIVSDCVEETIENIGKLAQSGMDKIDEVILGIMTNS